MGRPFPGGRSGGREALGDSEREGGGHILMTLGDLGALANAFWRAPWLIRNGPQVVMEAVWLSRPQLGSLVPETVLCRVHFSTTLEGPKDVPVSPRATVTPPEVQRMTHRHQKHLLTVLTSAQSVILHGIPSF